MCSRIATEQVVTFRLPVTILVENCCEKMLFSQQKVQKDNGIREQQKEKSKRENEQERGIEKTELLRFRGRR